MPMPDKLPEVGSHFAPPRAIPEDAEVPISGNRRPEVPLRQSPQRSGSAPPGADGMQTVVAKYPASPPTAMGGAETGAGCTCAGRARPRTEGRWAGAGTSCGALAHPAEADALLSAFLTRARVEGLAVPGGLTPELMQAIGTLVYHAMAGAMELIAARQITKREIGRRNHHRAQGQQSAQVPADARGSDHADAWPADAGVHEHRQCDGGVFDDLRAHEIGVIAGMRAALAEALLRFELGALEKRLGKGGLSNRWSRPPGRRSCGGCTNRSSRRSIVKRRTSITRCSARRSPRRTKSRWSRTATNGSRTRPCRSRVSQ